MCKRTRDGLLRSPAAEIIYMETWMKSEYCRSGSAAGPKLPPMQASPGYRSPNPSLAAATCMRRDRHPRGADVNTWKYGGPCSAALINQFYLKFLLMGPWVKGLFGTYCSYTRLIVCNETSINGLVWDGVVPTNEGVPVADYNFMAV